MRFAIPSFPAGECRAQETTNPPPFALPHSLDHSQRAREVQALIPNSLPVQVYYFIFLLLTQPVGNAARASSMNRPPSA